MVKTWLKMTTHKTVAKCAEATLARLPDCVYYAVACGPAFSPFALGPLLLGFCALGRWALALKFPNI